MSKILAVTGATGPKSGSAFLRKLEENEPSLRLMFPDGVRLLVRHKEKLKGLAKSPLKAEVCQGDLKDGEFLGKALSGVDTLVHIAGIQLSEKIADYAALAHVRRLILVHTTGIYSKYKAAGEGYRKIDEYVYKKCRDNGIVLTILRPTMIYGNITDRNIVKFIGMVDKLPVMPLVNGGRYKLQPVHYEDLADAYYRVLMHEGLTANIDFDLSGGEEIELREMLSVIGSELGKKVRFVSCPFAIAYAGAVMIYLLSLTKVDMREKVQRLCEMRVYSHEAATKAFGYSPRTFRDGIRGEVREYLNAK